MAVKAHKPCDYIIFGALGDLTRRKLIKAIYQLEKAKHIPFETQITGVARHEINETEFIEQMRKSLEEFMSEDIEQDVWERLSKRLKYLKMDLSSHSEYIKLHDIIEPKNRIMVNYCATPPTIYGDICHGLAAGGLIKADTRVVLEKPIGHDLKSSQDINNAVSRFFQEDQIYRIDHYLGKETVQNLLALRFANSIFTTNWDHNTIDHVQITVAEEVGIEGRWGYFDKSGQMRDMVQNHLIQILTLVAMEPPVNLKSDSLKSEKLKVLKAIRPITCDNVSEKTVRGQYTAGFLKGGPVPGYLEEKDGNDLSSTETFVALKVDIDNWRWADVPFYLRTGKRMPAKRSEIVIYFKQVPHNIFDLSYRDLPPNKLIIRLQPDEGVEVEMLNKIPGIGEGVKLQRTMLDLSFSEAFNHERISDAYERLILETMLGNQSLFIHRDEVELAWSWIDSIQNAWAEINEPPKSYPAGTWGPVASVALMARDGKAWEE